MGGTKRFISSLGSLVLGAGLLLGQQQILFTAPAPPAVNAAGITAQVSGTTGSQTYFYWVVARFPVGNAFPGGPGQVRGAADTLSVGNYVRVGWAPVTGATGYDVLRTTSQVMPSGACGCAVALNTSAFSVNDTSNALLAYTISTASSASGVLRLDNQNYSTPQLVFTPTISNSGTGTVAAGGVSFLQDGIGARTTDLLSRGKQILYATDFAGVDATGVTDSTAGMAAAVNEACNRHGVLVFPPGTYLGGIHITCSDIAITGDAKGTVTIRPLNDDGILVSSVSGLIDVTINGLWITPQAGATSGDGLHITAPSDGVGQNSRFVITNLVSFNNPGAGIRVENMIGGSFSNLVLTGNASGLNVAGVGSAQPVNTTVFDNFVASLNTSVGIIINWGSHNTFSHFDLEGNLGTSVIWLLRGSDNRFTEGYTEANNAATNGVVYINCAAVNLCADDRFEKVNFAEFLTDPTKPIVRVGNLAQDIIFEDCASNANVGQQFFQIDAGAARTMLLWNYNVGSTEAKHLSDLGTDTIRVSDPKSFASPSISQLASGSTFRIGSDTAMTRVADPVTGKPMLSIPFFQLFDATNPGRTWLKIRTAQGQANNQWFRLYKYDDTAQYADWLVSDTASYNGFRLYNLSNAAHAFYGIMPETGTSPAAATPEWRIGHFGNLRGFAITSFDGATLTNNAYVFPNGNVAVGTTTDGGQKLQVNGMMGLGAIAFGSLGAPANGTITYCNDCTIANPCAGAGTGALAKRLNGVWVCN